MLKTLHLSKEGSRYTALESAAFMTAANLPCALLHGVYLHQDAINPRKKKKKYYKIHSNCMLIVLGGEEAS